MLVINKIWAVAFYEAKTLRRSMTFRIYAFLSFIFIILLDFFYLIFLQNRPFWTIRCIPSSIPYMNMTLINIALAVIGIFVILEIIKQEKKENSVEVIYSRSMTNFEYILGKTIGIFIVFFCLNLVVLAIALVFNTAFVDDTPVNLISYVFYPLLLNIPTVIFIIGLSMVSIMYFSTPGILYLIIPCYVAITFLVSGSGLRQLSDYIALNTPFLYSDFVGFGNIFPILLIRGIYLLLGLGFIFISVLFFKRLPQSQFMNRISYVLSIFFFCVSVILGSIYFSKIQSGEKLRREMKAINNEIVGKPRVSITDCQLDLNHKGKEIEVKAEVVIKNNTSKSIDAYYFSLNPGLEIQKVISNGNDLRYTRNIHIIAIEPLKTLLPYGIDSINIHYSGKINEDACYVDIDEYKRWQNNRMFLYAIDKRFSFITHDYVLLTPENMWYPVAGVPYGSVFPKTFEKDFVNYILTIKTEKSLTAISQGSNKEVDDGTYVFKPEFPLPQLSLVIGDYEKKSINIDNIDYNIFVKKGHDYFSTYFNDLDDRLTKIIKNKKDELELYNGMSYPFKRFSLIEVPVQFYSFNRFWTICTGMVQPEQVFLHEKGFGLVYADFKSSMMVDFIEYDGTKLSTQTKKKEIINSFIALTLLSDYGPGGSLSKRNQKLLKAGFSLYSLYPSISKRFEYTLFPNYYGFMHNFSSTKYPLINTSLEFYLNSNFYYYNKAFNSNRIDQNITPEELAIINISEQELYDILEDSDKINSAYYILKLKADYLFALMKAELGNDVLEDFITEFLIKNRFKNLQFDEFLTALKTRTGFDFKPDFDQWNNSNKLPEFTVSDVSCTEIIEKDHPKYQLQFIVTNSQPVDGIISTEIKTAKRAEPGQRGETIKRYIKLRGNQSKEVGIVLDYKPYNVNFDTIFSYNLPLVFRRKIYNVKHDEKVKLFDGERIVDISQLQSELGVVIVDDDDLGFEVVSQPEEGFILKLFDKEVDEISRDMGINPWNPPNNWTKFNRYDVYGSKKSAYYKKPGKGDYKVQWSTKIPESGNYDIYSYITRFNDFHIRDNPNGPIKDLHYIVTHDQSVDELTLEINKSQSGWVYLGTYYFSYGTTKIELSDKSKGKIVYADAIKWVKR